MKAFLAVSLISCLLIVAYAIDFSCVTRLREVTPCITRLPSAASGADNNFCAECANSLVGYYQECTGRNDIDALLEGKWFVLLNYCLA